MRKKRVLQCVADSVEFLERQKYFTRKRLIFGDIIDQKHYTAMEYPGQR